ncbi:hypothetical protein [Acrocarpospora corrugata]|nr:hypothetical protein [Acrocarpospora corrugata]
MLEFAQVGRQIPPDSPGVRPVRVNGGRDAIRLSWNGACSPTSAR